MVLIVALFVSLKETLLAVFNVQVRSGERNLIIGRLHKIMSAVNTTVATIKEHAINFQHFDSLLLRLMIIIFCCCT